MSITRMIAVWNYSEHKGSALLLMLAIADNANEEYSLAWPGYAYLAQKIRMSRRQTIRLVELCNESGELWTFSRIDQQSNLYIVTVGLSQSDLSRSAEMAVKLGAATTMGSDNLSPPIQVLAVASRPLMKSPGVKLSLGGDKIRGGSDIVVSPGSDIAVSPEPSLIINQNHDAVVDPVLVVMVAFGIDPKVAQDLRPAVTLAQVEGWIAYAGGPRGRKIRDRPAYVVSRLQAGAMPPGPEPPDPDDRQRFIAGEFAAYIRH